VARDPSTGSRRVAFSSPPPKRSFWDKIPGSKIVAQGTKDIEHIVRSAPSSARDSWDELTAGSKERKAKGYTGDPFQNAVKGVAQIARHPLRNPGYTALGLLGVTPVGRVIKPKLPRKPIMHRPEQPTGPTFRSAAEMLRHDIEKENPRAFETIDRTTPAESRAVLAEFGRGDTTHIYPGLPPVYGNHGPQQIPAPNPFDSLTLFGRGPGASKGAGKYGFQSQEGHPDNFSDQPPRFSNQMIDDAWERAVRDRDEPTAHNIRRSIDEPTMWGEGPGDPDWESMYGDVESENPFDWDPNGIEAPEAKQDFSATPGGGDPDLDTAMAGTRDRALIEFLSEQYGGIAPSQMDRFQDLSMRDAYRQDVSEFGQNKIAGNRAQNDYELGQYEGPPPRRLAKLPKRNNALSLEALMRLLERGHLGNMN
jgi:hypothetical protein